MKANLLIDKTVEELSVEVSSLKEKLFDLRFQSATGQLDNNSLINKVKKDIARAKTVIRQKEIAAK
jgi:large subunit ribosomal protein L29